MGQNKELQAVHGSVSVHMLKFFEKRPFMWATHLWNMFDFAADARDQGGEPGMNHKGMVTFNRQIKKDSFYLYKAYWTKEPFVHLCGKRYVDRAGTKAYVKVYSNCNRVTLMVNGKEFATQTGDKVFNFEVPMSEDLHLEAFSVGCRDTSYIHKVLVPNIAYKLPKTEGKGENWV